MTIIAALLTSFLSAGCGGKDAASKVEGRWEGPGRANIDLRSDGTGDGNDGCNEIAADWASIDDTTGRFHVSESGDMGCVGTSGWDEASAYVLFDGKLIIESSDGEDLTELTRVD